MLPLPTTSRAVSGKNKNVTSRKVPLRRARNQKIQGQPAYCDSTPPMIGPKQGAAFVLGRVSFVFFEVLIVLSPPPSTRELVHLI